MIEPADLLFRAAELSPSAFAGDAYQCILGRSPTAEERDHMEACILRGDSAAWLLGLLRYGGEGRVRAVDIRGLRARYLAQRLFRIPVLGGAIEWLWTLFRIPALARATRAYRQFDARKRAEDEVRVVSLGVRTESISENLNVIRESLSTLDRTLHAELDRAQAASRSESETALAAARATTGDEIETAVQAARRDVSAMIQALEARSELGFKAHRDEQESTIHRFREALEANVRSIDGERDRAIRLERLLETGLVRVDAAIEALAATTGEARSKLDETRGELDKARSELDEARSELDETRSELDDTRGKLDEARGKLDETRGKLDETRGKLDETRARLEGILPPPLGDTLEIPGVPLVAAARENCGIAPSIAVDSLSEGQRYALFESVFYDTRAVAAKQRVYLPYIDRDLAHRFPFLDLGCGRGEFLRILAGEGIHTVGVDVNPTGFPALANERIRVVEADLLAFLEKDRGTYCGTSLLQVAEHLDRRILERVLQLVRTRLAPGALFILETPNPLSPLALSVFHSDPTHVAPLPPEAARYAVELAGFEATRTLFQARIPRELFAGVDPRAYYGDYAIIAQRGDA